MKYEVRTNKVENGTNGVVAMATVVIEDKFAVNNIRLVHKAEEDKYVVYYPTRPNTSEDSGYSTILHPYTSELAQSLREAILTSYNTGENQVVTNDTKFKLKVDVVPFEKEGTSLAAFCNVRLSDKNEFAVNDIQLRKNAEGNVFMTMPSYKKKDDTYADICNPITADFRKELNDAVMESYEKAKEMKNEKAATYEHKKKNAR
ncbi:MAG: septation protein SpoVG family protein [Lachnospiraceae bacterium]|nr:septation protein SpoVG family protein [Lachnospiraceae bacterium]